MADLETFAARVERLRQARGLHKKALEDIAGISKGYVSRIESGERYPSLAVIRRLAAALGVSADALEHGGGPEVVARANVGRIDAAAEQFGVPLHWDDLTDDERRQITHGIDVGLIDTLVARMHAVALNRKEASHAPRA